MRRIRREILQHGWSEALANQLRRLFMDLGLPSPTDKIQIVGKSGP